MSRHITRLTSAVLLMALLSGAGIAMAWPAQDVSQAEREGDAEIEPACIGIEKTAEMWWVLYDSYPEPFLLLPLIHSNPNEIGRITPGQQFTICKQVNRSTWNRRSTWLEVRVVPGPDAPDVRSGWITMSTDEANSWIPQP